MNEWQEFTGFNHSYVCIQHGEMDCTWMLLYRMQLNNYFARMIWRLNYAR